MRENAMKLACSRLVNAHGTITRSSKKLAVRLINNGINGPIVLNVIEMLNRKIMLFPYANDTTLISTNNQMLLSVDSYCMDSVKMLRHQNMRVLFLQPGPYIDGIRTEDHELTLSTKVSISNRFA